jgi:hypothetical protein
MIFRTTAAEVGVVPDDKTSVETLSGGDETSVVTIAGMAFSTLVGSQDDPPAIPQSAGSCPIVKTALLAADSKTWPLQVSRLCLN